MKRLNPTGDPNAPICIIGESPGKEEEYTGVPFVGGSGKLLNRLLRGAGIDRNECYITTVIKYHPPRNNIKEIGKLGLTLEGCMKELREELLQNNHKVIVPLGNVALEALTGQTSVMKYRGSILKSFDGQKVIPTIHPAAALRQFEVTALMMADFQRIKRESQIDGFSSIIDVEYVLTPSFEKVMDEISRMNTSEYLSLDIETDYGASYIKCVGITDKADWGICIPFVDGSKTYWSEEEEKAIWLALGTLLRNPSVKKIIQNASFEMTVLNEWVGEIYPVWMDTMLAQKLCYPELKKGLDTICSLYTNQPYYKDDAKNAGWESEALWKYNILDICITFQAAMKLQEELKSNNLLEFFHGYTMPLFRIFQQAFHTGLRIDMERLEEYYNTTVEKLITKQSRLEDAIGYPINVNSPTQIKKYLYQDLNMTPIRVSSGTGKGDEETLERLAKKHPEYAPTLALILEVRQLAKLLSTYFGGRKDKKTNIYTYDPNRIVEDDNRLRSNFLIAGTETGRLSSSKNVYDRGMNLQNQPKDIRDIFISDKGKSFVVGDMSQVEARLVAWLSEDLGLKTIFKKGGDIHKQVASWVFQVPIHQVTKSQRNISKHTVHGANYDIGPRQFAYKNNIPEKEGKVVLAQFHHSFPGVKAYHSKIRDELQRTRTLTSPFGRRRQFFGWWGDTLFRAAYASIPQGMAADIINMAAVRIHWQLPPGAQILIQVHDELVIQCYDKDINEVASLFKREVEMPFEIENDEIIIPLEIEIGKNWKDTQEWIPNE